jgi:hypothetical protein
MAGNALSPDVDALLEALLTGIRAILENELIGLYVDGSLALGDFDPARSDIDFIAATADDLSSATVDGLAAMHRRIITSGRPFAAELEGSYIPLRALRRYDTADAIHPNIERGVDEVLRLKRHHSDWVIHLHIVREYGLVLIGPPPVTLIDAVTPDELRAATAGVLHSWWATPDAADAIRDAHPGYLAYIVQTMCRALYTLELGKVASKPVACRWAMATQKSRWQPLIKRALEWDMDEDIVAETQAFVDNLLRYEVEK